jgi:hypothetical protein
MSLLEPLKRLLGLGRRQSSSSSFSQHQASQRVSIERQKIAESGPRVRARDVPLPMPKGSPVELCSPPLRIAFLS